MPRKAKKIAPPPEILSEDGTQKAVLIPHNGIVIADYYRLVGLLSRNAGWRWDRRAEVRIQPLEAALTAIQQIVNTPYIKRR